MIKPAELYSPEGWQRNEIQRNTQIVSLKAAKK